MKKKLLLLVATVLTISSYASIVAKEKVVSKEKNENYVSPKLPIPPMFDQEEFTLIPQNGEVEFFEGVKTKTRGYNGNLLGPTLKFEKGKNYDVTIKNEMEEETTVHWHGLLVDSDVDGVFQVIEKNESLQQNMEITQEASTAWYHPHTMHKTAEN